METERLILRPWKEADAESLYKYASNPKIGPIAGWSAHTSVENSREIIKTVFSNSETYALVLKETNEPIGCAGHMIGNKSHLALPNTECEVGYWIGVPYWGQGLVPEAVRYLVRYAFEKLKMNKIWCGYFDGNTKSKRVSEKCGFTYHHTAKDVPCDIENLRRTEHITCLTIQEWEKSKESEE